MRFKHAALAAGLLFACSLASAQGVKISQLPTAPTPNGAEILPESLGACTPNSISCGVTINQIGAFTLANAATLGQLDLTLGVKNILPVANGGTGTATPSLVAGTNITITGSWPNQTIAASGGGGGSGTVTDGTGTTTANELLLSSTTAHAYTNATTLPTSALPALTGDVTSSAGSNSVTVSKVSGSAGTPTTITTYNATSGSITVSPPTGALGTINLTWPDASGIIPAITGTITTGDCAKFASATSVTDAGAACGSSSMVYPGAGIPNSTGSGWGASYSTSGSGNVALTTSPTLVTPVLTGYATASLPTCNSSSKGSLAYTTDGTPAFAFCNGTTWSSNGGTTFTIAGTGCTPTAATGDATGGSFTLAAGPCTAVTITFNGAVGMTAPNMWVCSVSDQTLQNAGTWFGTWGQSASTTTQATIPIPPAAGTTDVITFNCTPH